DSALVYRGMDIGTAKPSRLVRERVPHHLIDIADPLVAYSAGRFATDARAAAADIAARGRIPLLVGGTLLYQRALRGGLADLPEADPELRRCIDAQAEASGWPALHARLADLDPDAAAKIAPTDRQRIQRALEVYELTGEVISVHQRRGSRGDGSVRVTTLAIVVDDRAALAQRIEQRFEAMLDAGFVAEVEALMVRGDLDPDLPAIRAVGYRQIWGYLSGDYDWAEARRRALAATRQLAKRQMTWIRSEENFGVLPWSNKQQLSTVRDWARSAAGE
ncbi:MAG: tRNA (adenosine(37)-N6)-dimethylallyltransferase MiaA, partial [Gammaproteobacteria bacterium]|nr:tRNA (adenosine(37)-N6)-dimethylallyltransferase MiaA [Gammaproteobacteria bacterium]